MSNNIGGINYAKLRYSFDNILKELDDICKSIDDLTNLNTESTPAPYGDNWTRRKKKLPKETYTTDDYNYNTSRATAAAASDAVDAPFSFKSRLYNTDRIGQTVSNHEEHAYSSKTRNNYENFKKYATQAPPPPPPPEPPAHPRQRKHIYEKYTQSLNEHAKTSAKANDDFNNNNNSSNENQEKDLVNNLRRLNAIARPTSTTTTQPQIPQQSQPAQLPASRPQVQTIKSTAPEPHFKHQPQPQPPPPLPAEQMPSFKRRIQIDRHIEIKEAREGVVTTSAEAAASATTRQSAQVRTMPLLNNVVGSVQDVFVASFPMTTASPLSSSSSPPPSSSSAASSSSSSSQAAAAKTTLTTTTTSTNTKEEQSKATTTTTTNNTHQHRHTNLSNQHPSYHQPPRNEPTQQQHQQQQSSTPVASKSSNEDHLQAAEIAKIEYFYGSMDCYVYVSRCIAELYQLKREERYDEMADGDPVTDYYMYMQRMRHRHQPQPGDGVGSSAFSDAYNGDNVDATNSMTNYMYINSGVPVIVFNFGNNSTRSSKDLRLVLAERSTGFCMFEFKFDGLTEFESSTRSTVFRLTFSDLVSTAAAAHAASLAVPTGGDASNTSSSLTSTSKKVSWKSGNGDQASPSATTSGKDRRQQFKYQNEYFERFFSNSMSNRHAHKDHLLKFADKSECDEFYGRLATIMSDKGNATVFFLNRNDYDMAKPSASNAANANTKVRQSSSSSSSPPTSVSDQTMLAAATATATSNRRLRLDRTVSSASNANNNSPNSTYKSALALASMPLDRPSVIVCHFDAPIIAPSHAPPTTYARHDELSRSSSRARLNEAESAMSFATEPITFATGLTPIVIKSAIKKSVAAPAVMIERGHSKSSSNLFYDSSNYSADFFRSPAQPQPQPLAMSDFFTAAAGANGYGGYSAEHADASSLTGFSVQQHQYQHPQHHQPAHHSPVKKTLLLKKSDISSPLNFNHVTHLDKPVPIGKRYRFGFNS